MPMHRSGVPPTMLNTPIFTIGYELYVILPIPVPIRVNGKRVDLAVTPQRLTGNPFHANDNSADR